MEKLRTAVLTAAVILLIATAVLLGAARILLSDADVLQGQVERRLSERLGVPVRVERVEGRVTGLRPVIELAGVSAGNAAIELRIRELVLKLDPLASLLAAAPRLAVVAADGVRLRLAGRGPAEQAPGNALADWMSTLRDLPLPDRARLTDGRLTWKPAAGAPARVVEDIELSLHHRDGGPRLQGRFVPPQALAEPVVFVFEMPDVGSAAARGYLRVHGLDLGRAGGLLAALGRPLPSRAAGTVDGELWFRIGAGALAEASVRIDAAGVSVEGGNTLTRLAGAAHWRRLAAGWRADLELTDVTPVAGRAWRPLRASVVRGGDSWRLGLEGVDLGQALALAGPYLPQPWQAHIARHRPEGTLAALGVAWAGSFDAGNWRARGELRDFGMAAEPGPEGRLPGIAAVDVTFEADPRGGRFRIRGRDGALALPWLFRAPLPFETVFAAGEWHVDPGDGRVLVRVPELAASSVDGHGRARVSIWAGGGRPPFLDIRAVLENGSAARTSLYLPTAIMPPKLVAWLDQAIVDGEVPRADLVLFGPAAAFPFREDEGVFDIRARVRNARFAYFPGWPALEDVAGELHFHNESMTITGRAGHIHGVRLQQATARIPNLKSPRLTVDGRFLGPGEDLLRFLVEAPVAEAADGVLSALSLGGEHELALNLLIPFHHQPISVNGELTLESAELGIAELGYRITDLNGVIRFDRDGLSWDGLQGRFAGAPVLSKAVTVGQGSEARIRSNTRFRAGAVDLFPDAALAQRLQGRAEWLLTVEAAGFRAGPLDARIVLDSDLQGLAVQAPQPFGKPGELARRFSLSGRLAPPARLPWRLQYGDGVSALVQLDASRSAVERIGLRFGAGEPSLPAGPGLRVAGRLPALPELPAQWPDAAAGPVTPAIPGLTELDLTLEQLGFAGFELGPVTFTGSRGERGWRLRLTGAAAGEATWRPDGGGLDLRLDRLQLRQASPELVTEAEGRPAPEPPPIQHLPDIAARIAELRIDERLLGELLLDLETSPRSIRLRNLWLDNPHGLVTLEGAWETAPDRSWLKARVDTGNAGALLAQFGIAPALKQGHGEASAELRWEGPLRAPELDTLDGEVRLDLRDGVLPAVEPGAGRLVGLLSLSLVPRRLALDFSDVTQEGLHFDRLHAHFLLENGVARPEFFTVSAPAARIEVEGPIDLAAQRYDQIVTVVPQVSSTLPLIGALAAGPQVALALFLADRLLGAGVDKLTRFRYRIEGSWDDPQLSPVPSPDDAEAQEPGPQ